MILMHLGNVLHKRYSHVFLNFKYSIELFTTSKWGWNERRNFEAVKSRANVIIVFVDLIVIEVKRLEFCEVPQL